MSVGMKIGLGVAAGLVAGATFMGAAVAVPRMMSGFGRGAFGPGYGMMRQYQGGPVSDGRGFSGCPGYGARGGRSDSQDQGAYGYGPERGFRRGPGMMGGWTR